MMPTLPTGSSNNRGLTLIELVIVIFLLSLMTALVAPRLPLGSRSAFQSAASQLGTMTRFLHNEAALSGRPIRLEFDLPRGSCQALQQREDGTFVAETGRNWRFQLPSGLSFSRLERLGASQLRTATTQITFQPQGWADETRIWLREDQQEMAWDLNPLTGVLQAAADGPIER